MASTIQISVNSGLTQAQAQRLLQIDPNKDREGLRAIKTLFNSIPNQVRAILTVQTGSAAPAAASGTATCASVAVNDTITIGNITFTAKASPSLETEFSQAGSDTADAASLASKINAHSTLQYVMAATSSLGVVTITCKQKGVIGNTVGLASSNGTRLAVSGSGFFAGATGGAMDTASSYSLGL